MPANSINGTGGEVESNFEELGQALFLIASRLLLSSHAIKAPAIR